MRKLCLSIILFFSIFCHNAFSQENKFWVFFSDKPVIEKSTTPLVSEAAVKKRLLLGLPVHQYTDIPVSNTYINKILETGAKLDNRSKWLNAISVKVNDLSALEKIRALSFVDDIQTIRIGYMASREEMIVPENYTYPLQQINASSVVRRELDGSGVRVGIIDAGFTDADSSRYFQHIFKSDRVLAYRDFINPDRENMYEAMTNADYHGREVWKRVAGYDEETDRLYGLATGAEFLLARTENGIKEHRVEEDDWVAAIEWMDSLGVRIVNTSLGYSVFDDSTENYTPEQMDGKTAVITRAANIATTEKGIFVVASAGNSGGNKDWRMLISAPADSPGVLSIGATNNLFWDKISYSSIGPDYIQYLKPDVSCFSPNGTSFSSPVICGLATTIIQYKPDISNNELRKAIQQAGHLYPFGNNYIGYGVPMANRCFDIIDEGSLKVQNDSIVENGKNYKFEVEGLEIENVVLFHKIDERIVEHQQILSTGKRKKKKSELRTKKGDSKIRIVRPDNVKRTTVQYRDEGIKVFEIIWE